MIDNKRTEAWILKRKYIICQNQLIAFPPHISPLQNFLGLHSLPLFVRPACNLRALTVDPSEGKIQWHFRTCLRLHFHSQFLVANCKINFIYFKNLYNWTDAGGVTCIVSPVGGATGGVLLSYATKVALLRDFSPFKNSRKIKLGK